jgi:alpha-galactosidase
MDQFTIDLLSNDEVIAVNQDPLGRQAKRITQDGYLEVWARPLWDGTVAVGLFNRGPEGANVSVRFSDLGLTGTQSVRDLWRRKALSPCNGSFGMYVPSHGARLLKLGKPKRR